MKEFLKTLQVQRWDDHRYYHHNRINQSLHLLSALSFVVAYVWLLVDPVVSALIAWLVSMTTRQIGHFFFEPRDYDAVNQATHEHKEEIKIGYNLFRKVVLMAIWVLSPLLLWVSPTLFGLTHAATGFNDLVQQVGNIWLAVGVGGLLFRIGQLWVQQDLRTGLVWITKILTDPFHDVMLYWKSPYYLLRGELIDPMEHATSAHEATR